MIRTYTNLFRFTSKLKHIKPEPWVIRQESSAEIPFAERDLSHLNIQDYKELRKQPKNENNNVSLETETTKATDFKPEPVVARVGTYTVINPKISGKMYRWCSCGLSSKQPFCDNSHKGSAFKPVRFTIQQKVDSVELCGCKKTSNAPFCDKKGCCQGSA